MKLWVDNWIKIKWLKTLQNYSLLNSIDLLNKF